MSTGDHCQPAGSVEHALRYLSRYAFKAATGNRPLQLLPNGRVRWPYRNSTTGRVAHLDLEPGELVRRSGWLHPASRPKLNRVRALLLQARLLTEAERAAWQLPGPTFEPPELLPSTAESAPGPWGDTRRRWPEPLAAAVRAAPSAGPHTGPASAPLLDWPRPASASRWFEGASRHFPQGI